MSDYAGVIAIPDYLNISDWYELVDGDSVPQGWTCIILYTNGTVNIFKLSSSHTKATVRRLWKAGHRQFTRTPPPSAIKRIREQQTNQPELNLEDDQPTVGWVNRTEQRLLKLEQTLNSFIDGA